MDNGPQGGGRRDIKAIFTSVLSCLGAPFVVIFGHSFVRRRSPAKREGTVVAQSEVSRSVCWWRWLESGRSRSRSFRGIK
jgi:hypothetical protein